MCGETPDMIREHIPGLALDTYVSHGVVSDDCPMAGMILALSVWERRAGNPGTAEVEPVVYVSPGQLAIHKDPEPTDPYHSEAGMYLPVRKTPGGCFTLPLYAHPAAAREDGEAGGMAGLLAKAIGEITAALILAGKKDKVAEWTKPYVDALNAFDATTRPASPELSDDAQMTAVRAGRAWGASTGGQEEADAAAARVIQEYGDRRAAEALAVMPAPDHANCSVGEGEAAGPPYRDADFLSELRRVNGERWLAWAEGAAPDPLYMANEFGGEAGEVLNVVKKLEREARGWRGSRDTVEHLGEEIGDCIICLDSLARAYGLDLTEVTAAKFNKTSDANGFPHRIDAACQGHPS
jgi:NTP pyrophosphatase (non-canonical NTP hydrolase)